MTLIVPYKQPTGRNPITSHDLQAAKYTKQYIDPQIERRDLERTRKRLVIDRMNAEIQTLQQQIAFLESEIRD